MDIKLLTLLVTYSIVQTSVYARSVLQTPGEDQFPTSFSKESNFNDGLLPEQPLDENLGKPQIPFADPSLNTGLETENPRTINGRRRHGPSGRRHGPSGRRHGPSGRRRGPGDSRRRGRRGGRRNGRGRHNTGAGYGHGNGGGMGKGVGMGQGEGMGFGKGGGGQGMGYGKGGQGEGMGYGKGGGGEGMGFGKGGGGQGMGYGKGTGRGYGMGYGSGNGRGQCRGRGRRGGRRRPIRNYGSDENYYSRPVFRGTPYNPDPNPINSLFGRNSEISGVKIGSLGSYRT